MRTSRSIGHGIGALALALALALVGCGGDDGGSTVTDDTESTGSEADDAGDGAGDAAGASDADDADEATGDEDVDGEGTDAADGEDAGEGEQAGDGAGEGSEDAAAPGVYRDYSADAVADTSYDTTVVFFWASWCPECRAFEQAIESEGVPDGVQILKADYDTEHDLRERYGVNIQTTFVQVDPDGNELATWVGYGEDKSVDAILDSLG